MDFTFLCEVFLSLAHLQMSSGSQWNNQGPVHILHHLLQGCGYHLPVHRALAGSVLAGSGSSQRCYPLAPEAGPLDRSYPFCLAKWSYHHLACNCFLACTHSEDGSWHHETSCRSYQIDLHNHHDQYKGDTDSHDCQGTNRCSCCKICLTWMMLVV